MPLDAVFGAPPKELCSVPAGALQLSPLTPGARSLEELPEGLASMAMLAPPGTIERRYALALTIRALVPGAPCVALAPKDKGGSRIAKELREFGCEVTEDARSHHRICSFPRPVAPAGLDEAIAEGAPRLLEELGMWTQPGVFSWNRRDPGSLLLLAQLPALSGNGADLGCGIGLLSREILKSPKVKQLHLFDVDGRAVSLARKNIPDGRAVFRWADLRTADSLPGGLDFVVTNPPFHDGGAEDQSLGKTFLRQAASMLRAGGSLWLVANRHLPYEEVLRETFQQVGLKAEANGFKVYEARR